jgi:hypothetical protein
MIMRIKWCLGLLAVVVLALGRSDGVAQQPLTLQGVQNALENDAAVSREFSRGEVSRIIRGFQIAPVPLNLHGKNLALVGLGSYIVNAQGGCNDCHTSPPYAEGGDPFLGERTKVNAARYLAGGTPFGDPTNPDTPFSRNLTPRASSGLPAGLTWQQFLQVFRTGADLKHRRPFVPSAERDLLQVMPWPVYGDMTDRDLRAMYEYLRSIPSLPSTP